MGTERGAGLGIRRSGAGGRVTVPWKNLRAALAVILGVLSISLITGCAASGPAERSTAVTAGDDLVVVAVADTNEARAAAGGAARSDYRQAQPYGNGDAAKDTALALARHHGLSEIKAWSITALQWRCMLYRLPAGSTRSTVLASLAADPRVQLAQPLHEFETLARVDAGAAATNDPYLALQAGYAAIDAGHAQRMSRGQGVTVAVIDTGVDGDHPELSTQIRAARDFVGGASDGATHGTAVAGVIAAAANNGIGIAGVAPAARLLSLRACWSVARGQPARCNSFTLAQALAEAIAAGADVINLSLGGPRDPLLERLTEQAMARGAIVVGATPAGGRRSGFPSALPGVVAVATAEGGKADAGVIAAPGVGILTLSPGGGYDYNSGASLAAAHVSGAIALLRAEQAGIDGAQAERLLDRGGLGIDVCQALQRLQPGKNPGRCKNPG